MNNEFVSIILPTYNRAHCLQASIESLLNQTYPYFEILIIDDCSSDNTEEIVNNIKDNRVFYYKNDYNCGPSCSRNRGISLANYDYIAFQDSDDLWLPNKLELQMQLITSDSSLGLVYTTMKNHESDGSITYTPSLDESKEQLQGNIFANILVQNFIGIPTTIIRKECFSKIGVFNESFNALEDWELFIRITKEYPVGYISSPLFIYNKSDSGNVSSDLFAYFESRCNMIKMYKSDMISENVLPKILEDIFAKSIMFNQTDTVGAMLLDAIT